jgi:hypothetical protein
MIESLIKDRDRTDPVRIPLRIAEETQHDCRGGGVKVRRERGSRILTQYCQPKNGTTKDTKDTKEKQRVESRFTNYESRLTAVCNRQDAERCGGQTETTKTLTCPGEARG